MYIDILLLVPTLTLDVRAVILLFLAKVLVVLKIVVQVAIIVVQTVVLVLVPLPVLFRNVFFVLFLRSLHFHLLGAFFLAFLIVLLRILRFLQVLRYRFRLCFDDFFRFLLKQRVLQVNLLLQQKLNLMLIL